MAVFTLTITDTDLVAGAFKCETKVEDAQTDDGKVTAAHMTGHFLSLQVPQESFRDGAFQFATRLIEALEEEGSLPEPTTPRTLVITLADTDLEKGHFQINVSGDGGSDVRPTSAQIAGYYMRALLNDVDFVQRVWAYAAELVANSKGSATIENDSFKPGTVPSPHSDAATLAA